jgi:DNA modification methylase
VTTSRLDLDSVVLRAGGARTILAGMPPTSVDCVVTSPPYWRQRDYCMPGQLGLEDALEAYAAPVFDQLARPAIGIDLNPEFHLIAQQRLGEDSAAEPSDPEGEIG